jgi:GTPase SAR1 family protein
MEILLIGPENSGKSYLLKCLRKLLRKEDENQNELDFVDEKNMTRNILPDNAGRKVLISYCPDEGTASTVGVDIVDFSFGDRHFKITELGGSIVSRWFTYYEACSAVIFVIDISSPGSWPTSMVSLYEAVSYDKQLANKPFLLVLTKKDLCDIITFKTGINMLCLHELLTERQATQLISGSLFDLSFIEKIADWLRSVVSAEK